MEAVRDDEQSPPKAGRTGLPQGRLSEVSGRLTVACLFTAAGGNMDAFDVRCSEYKLYRQLDRTRAANLIERVEARTIRAGQTAG
jgi:hypothetical protein